MLAHLLDNIDKQAVCKLAEGFTRDFVARATNKTHAINNECGNLFVSICVYRSIIFINSCLFEKNMFQLSFIPALPNIKDKDYRVLSLVTGVLIYQTEITALVN